MPEFLAVASSVQGLPAGKWFSHQSALAVALNLRDEELIEFLGRISNGGTGVRRNGTFTANPDPFGSPINLKDTSLDNALSLHSETYRVALSSNSEALSEPSVRVLNESGVFFRSGRVRNIRSIPTLKQQLDIARWCVGTHQTLIRNYPKIAKRRQEIVEYWSSQLTTRLARRLARRLALEREQCGGPGLGLH